MFKSNKKKYNFVFSLGEACSCTDLLKAYGLRDFSCPVDWTLGSTFSQRVDLLTRYFVDFMNKEDLEFVKPYDKALDSTYTDTYKNTRNGLYFSHHFPASVSLENSFEEVACKYNRRINNLMRAILTSKKILIVYMEMPKSTQKLENNEILINGIAKIAKKFPHANFNLLYITNSCLQGKQDILKEKVSENIEKFTANYSMEFGKDYEVDFDVLSYVFDNIYLDKGFVHEIKISVLKFFIAFIPIKKVRDKLRKIFNIKKRYRRSKEH